VFAGTLSYLHSGAFTGKSGEVQLMTSGANVMVNVDINGDKAADMQFALADTNISMFSADHFIL
jgi:hypothetical protein